MFNRKKLLSVFLAGALSVSSMFVTTAFAADDDDDDDKIEMTFDGQYSMDDLVDYEFFETENDYEVQEKLEEIIRKAAGAKSFDEITYGDLAKVKTLNLSKLDLIDVPSCINYMVNITRLDLSSNLLQSDALKKLSLLGCAKLSNINLSDNYLTTMPSWFVSDRVTSGNITKNFVDSSNPRGIKSLLPTYYLMDGEALNENNLKNQILKSIRLNDGSLLPEIFFEYNAVTPPYPRDPDDEYPYELDFETWEPFVTDGKVVAAQNKTIEVTIKLFNEANNDNTKTTVTIYLLNGKDLASLKLRLDGMVKECDDLKEEDYTENSWTKFTQANDTAKAILEYEKADVQMLTSALESLSKARSSLVYGIKELESMLDGLVSVGETYKQEDYTPASWNRFSSALEKIKEIQSDPNARLEEAQRAVKNFQSAQAGLTSAELSVPAKILKSQFEDIFGENKTVRASGITLEGNKYTWTFNGRDLKTIADFTPEVKTTDAAEPDILIEAGSKSGYKMFATAGKDALPGKATLELDVSDKFTSGSFYLYKWDSAAKRSLMSGTAAVTDGIARIPLTEGGVYYLCRNIQNFELKSSRFDVDTAKKSVTFIPKKSVKVSEFKNTFEFGAYTSVLDADGNAVSSNSVIKTGMTINAPNMDKYSIKLIGDADNNGSLDFDDVAKVVQAFLAGGTSEDASLCDIDGQGGVDFSDVNLIVQYFLEI